MGEGMEPVRTASAAGWLTPREASALLTDLLGRRIPARTLLAWCQRPRSPLGHARVGGRTLLHKTELLAFINSGSEVLEAESGKGQAA